MIRAGEGGYLVEDFERTGHVAIGWREAGDFTPIQTLGQMRERLAQAYPDEKPGWLGNAAAMCFKFRKRIRPGDRVVTYDPQRREYLIGTMEATTSSSPD
jgi:restriction system protein